MEAIIQTTSSNAFSWMKMYKFYIEISPKFVLDGVLDGPNTIFQH